MLGLCLKDTPYMSMYALDFRSPLEKSKSVKVYISVRFNHNIIHAAENNLTHIYTKKMYLGNIKASNHVSNVMYTSRSFVVFLLS